MTTQDVRRTLESILDEITTLQFSHRVTVCQNKILPEDVNPFLISYSNEADAFVTLASKLLGKPFMLGLLSSCADPNVMFVVFTRYQRLMQMFKDSEPKKDWDFPSDDPADFLTKILIEEWKLFCQGQPLTIYMDK